MSPNTFCPANAFAVKGSGAGGARSRWKSATMSMSERFVTGAASSSGSIVLSNCASSAVFPFGAFSCGKKRFVMPISFRYASAEKPRMLACWFFIPRRPTRCWPVATSVMIAALPVIPSTAGRSASALIVSSGIASSRPRPKSGGVCRRAIVFASRGMNSRTAGSIALAWSSEPPSDSSGSKTPFTVRPKRVTKIWLTPPGAGAAWQDTQDTLLKIGPSPRSGVSTFRNSTLP